MLVKFFKNSAIRMALRYSLIYGALLIVVVLIYNWSLQTPIDKNIRTVLFDEITTSKTAYKKNGIAGLVKYINEQNESSRKLIYYLSDKKGEKLAGNLRQQPEDIKDITIKPKNKIEEVSYIYFEEQFLPLNLLDDEAYLPTTLELFDDNELLIIAHPTPRSYMLGEVSEFLLDFTIPLILLSMLLAITLAFAIMRRLNTISHTAKDIMQGDITQRIPLSGKNDEFDELSQQLNNMMDRIQKLIESMSQVTDNVAHDLRSPLTRLRNNFEVTLLEERSIEEYKSSLNSGIRDVDALLKTFNSLLSIANVESGNHRSRWKKVPLNTLLADLVELYEPLAAEKEQRITYHSSNNVEITASRDLLAQAFSNLIENAIKYTPISGKIEVNLSADQNFITVSVSDSGPGIPTHEQEHVLERFVRLDNSRNTPGNGLGLSLVKAVSELHKGSLHFSNAKPGLIATIKFKLPH